MSNVDVILKNFRDVSMNARDSIKQMIVSAKKTNRLNIKDQELTLLFQIIDSGIDNAWGNSEKVMRNVINKNIIVNSTIDVKSSPKKK